MIPAIFSVYGLFEGDACLYVGQTQNVAKRVIGHRRHILKNHAAELRVISEFPTRASALLAEKKLIAEYRLKGEAELNGKGSRFQVEIYAELEPLLRKAAEKANTTPTRLANAIIGKDLAIKTKSTKRQ